MLTLPSGERRDFFDCPVNLVPPDLMAYLRPFSHFRSERDWSGGGVGAMDNRDLRAMEVLSDECARIEEAQREPARAAARRSGVRAR